MSLSAIPVVLMTNPAEKDQSTSKDTTYDLLREKIKSKMEVAKLLGTFLTGALAVMLAVKGEGTGTGSEVLQSPVFPLAILFILIAITLFFATVFAYDRLLMPFEYWTYPPAPNKDVLQKLMVRSSRLLFGPAVVAFALGIALFVHAFLKRGTCVRVIFGVALAVSVAYAWAIVTAKPKFD
jgi:hypothetical protein